MKITVGVCYYPVSCMKDGRVFPLLKETLKEASQLVSSAFRELFLSYNGCKSWCQMLLFCLTDESLHVCVSCITC